MDLLEIIMLIIGAALFIISSLLIHDRDKNDTVADENNAIKQFSDSLSSVSEEIINRTEEYLNKLSNEKIMSVSEYSEQVLEKINRNHEEVVFIYNMLSHKEKELKETLKELNDFQLKSRELMLKSQELNNENPLASYPPKKKRNKKNENIGESKNENLSVSVNNEEILNLYSQGMSVLEISKKLGIGQGEVKLIIDLFNK